MIFLYIYYPMYMISVQDDPVFQFPADLNKAYKHRLANRIFKGPIPHNRDDRENMQRCECCNRRIGDEAYKERFCYSPTKDLEFLGPGVPLLFAFIQNTLIGLLLFTGIFSFYAVISNLQGQDYGQINNWLGNMFTKLTLSNKISNNDILTIQTFLIGAFLLAQLITKQILVFRIRKEQQKQDFNFITPSEYSIFIARLAQCTKIEDIQNMIKNQQRTMTTEEFQAANKLRVAKIVLSYDPQEYVRRRRRQEKRFLKAKAKDSLLPFEFADIPKPSETGDFAVVVFDSPLSKEVFLEGAAEGDFKVVFGSCESAGRHKVKGKSVVVKRAPQPQDIIWENAAIPVARRIRNIILSYLLMAVILTSGGILQYYLQRQKFRLQRQGIANSYSYILSIVLIIQGIIIEKVLVLITSYQGSHTVTHMNQSLMKKTCFFQFLNVGLIFVIAYYFADETGKFDLQLGGFAEELTFFMVINAIQPTLLHLIITKLQLIKNVKRFFVKYGLRKCSQMKANQIYQKPQFQYAIKYAYVIKTFWITLFYAPFVPAIVLVSMIGLVLFYFGEKQLIRTSYSIPNMVSIKMAQAARRLLDLSGIIALAGQILVILYIKNYYRGDLNDWSLIEIVGLIATFLLFILVLVLPAAKLNQILFPLEAPPIKPNYSKVKDQFTITYEMANPYNGEQGESAIYSIKREAHEYRLQARLRQAN